MSTFESLLKHYEVKDPKVIYVGKIIHDIEVNTWERKIFEETRTVQEAVDQIIRNSKNSDEVVEKSCEYFDWLYGRVQSFKTIPHCPNCVPKLRAEAAEAKGVCGH